MNGDEDTATSNDTTFYTARSKDSLAAELRQEEERPSPISTPIPMRQPSGDEDERKVETDYDDAHSDDSSPYDANGADQPLTQPFQTEHNEDNDEERTILTDQTSSALREFRFTEELSETQPTRKLRQDKHDRHSPALDERTLSQQSKDSATKEEASNGGVSEESLPLTQSFPISQKSHSDDDEGPTFVLSKFPHQKNLPPSPPKTEESLSSQTGGNPLVLQEMDDVDDLPLTQMPETDDVNHHALTTDDAEVDDQIFDFGLLDVSSSDSEDESGYGSDSDEERNSLLERRKQNEKRNEKRMESLGLGSLKPKRRPNQKKVSIESTFEDEEDSSGMLLPTLFNGLKTPPRIKELPSKYPGREHQIKEMEPHFRVFVEMARMGQSIIPEPIFVQGMAGQGKTSVVREMAWATQQEYSTEENPVGVAYINCRTQSPGTIDALVKNAYVQISTKFDRPKSRKRNLSYPTTNGNKRRVKAMHGKTSAIADRPKDHSDKETGKAVHADEDTKDIRKIPAFKGSEKLVEKGGMKTDGLKGGSSEVGAIQDARGGESLGGRKRETEQTDATMNANNVKRGDEVRSHSVGIPARQRLHRNVKNIQQTKAKVFRRRKDEQEGIHVGKHSVTLELGRALVPLIGDKGNGCAFLILDHGERLLTLNDRRSNAMRDTNYLSYLLLLPRLFKLRLTILVIHKDVFLVNSSIDNTGGLGLKKSKTMSSISGTIMPRRIVFPRYRGTDFFRILNKPKFLDIIVGQQRPDSAFHLQVIRSFIHRVVDAVSSKTSDIRAMVAFGRDLWPKFIEPITPGNINSSIASLSATEQTENLEQALLNLLNLRIMDAGSARDRSWRFVYQASTTGDIPYLAQMLLLSAFICQHNRQELDRRIFDPSGTKQRRRQARKSAVDAEEETVTEGVHQLQLRPFPLERLLSIYVSLVTLHGRLDVGPNVVQESGNVIFLQHVNQFSTTGQLKETTTNPHNRTFVCPMGRGLANKIAHDVDLPLSQFLCG